MNIELKNWLLAGGNIGNPTLLIAIAGLNGNNFHNNNVWSKTSGLALKVATQAGGGRPGLYERPHGPYPKFLPHFHKWNRSGGHSFYSF